MALGIGSMLPFFKPVSDWVEPRRNTMLGFSAGMLEGDPGAAMRYAMAGRATDQQGAIAAQERAQKEQERNATTEWLKKSYPQFANLPPAEGFKAAMEMMQQAQSNATAEPANWREWEKFSQLTPEQQSQYLTMKRSVPFLDVGTEFARPDPLTGQVGPTVVKDNFTPAYDSAVGTGQGKVDVETQAAADSLASKMPGLTAVVGELSELAKTATYTQTGQLIDNAMRETGMEPGEAAVARTKYIAMVDNQVLPLLRDTFGAAFTVKEGETLRATLGDPNKAPAEKQAILEAFIEQKTRDLEALQSRLPGAAPAGGSGDVDGILKGYGL